MATGITPLTGVLLFVSKVLALVSTFGYGGFMAQIPTIKFPSLRLPKVDLPHITVPKLNLAPLHNIDLTNADIRKVLDSDVVERAKAVAGSAKDVAFTAIGFGVLAFQKAQVRQREILDALLHSDRDSKDSVTTTA